MCDLKVLCLISWCGGISPWLPYGNDGCLLPTHWYSIFLPHCIIHFFPFLVYLNVLASALLKKKITKLKGALCSSSVFLFYFMLSDFVFTLLLLPSSDKLFELCRPNLTKVLISLSQAFSSLITAI